MERAHDISIDEPTVAHQAILYMLDVLMRNDNQALTIAQLYDSFGDKTFTPQMLRAVGGNEQGLKQFLSRYPSLFTIQGDTVSANSGNSMRITPERQSSTTTSSYLKRNKSKDEDLNHQTIEYNDSKTMKEIEQEAIAFFKKQMIKREEDWLPIVSVAGHASQSSSDVRKYVGPQNEFKSFLQKYTHVFVVRDEYCGLKGRADLSTQPFPPPSPPPKRRVTTTSTTLNRSQSFKNRYSTCSITSNSMIGNLNNTSNLQNSNLNLSSALANSTINIAAQQQQQQQQQQISKPRLTPLEVKAVHYVMRILHKQGRLVLQNIPGLISRAPDHVSNIVGFTREDLIQFFKRHSAIFQLHPDGCVSVKQDAIKALILKERNFCDQTIFSLNGIILRIFPKYGILNLDNNEQVFFDIQSCQFETFADLTTILHVGDRLWFNAVIGPRDGSTKWRSIKTWINNQSLIGDNVSSDAGKSDDSLNNGHYNNNGLLAQQQQQYHHQQQQINGNFAGTSNNLSANGMLFNNGATSSSNQSSTTNSIINIEEDYNQYQLDVEYNDSNDQQQQQQQQQVGVVGDGKLLTNDLDGDLKRLSLTSSQSLPLISTNNNNNTSIPTSPTQQQQQQLLVNLNSNMNSTRMFMKHASDNISRREVCSFNSQFVSMGCQTVSTGDIMATNVCIE
jgi:exonuclease 3'-5' domain-containing protein 1